MRRLGSRPQRTLTRSAALTGSGFLSGQLIQLQVRPAPPNTGLVFIRTDLRTPVRIPAKWDQVTGTQRRTTLGIAPHSVALVEHVLAALAGLRIDNCWIEIDGPEPPGMDGSAAAFVELVHSAGINVQPARRAIWTIEEPITVAANGATLTLHPAETDELRVSYLLDYGPDSPIIRQKHTLAVTAESFASEVARCRTFVLEDEAVELRRQGIGRHIGVADVLIFGQRGPLGDRLRFADEPARHKILDVVGDLALLGCDLRGHVVGYRSGHPLNVELVRKLADTMPEQSFVPRQLAA